MKSKFFLVLSHFHNLTFSNHTRKGPLHPKPMQTRRIMYRGRGRIFMRMSSKLQRRDMSKYVLLCIETNFWYLLAKLIFLCFISYATYGDSSKNLSDRHAPALHLNDSMSIDAMCAKSECDLTPLHSILALRTFFPFGFPFCCCLSVCLFVSFSFDKAATLFKSLNNF